MQNNLLKQAKEVLVKAEERVHKVLPIFPLNVFLEDNLEKAIPELGICGQFIKAKNQLNIWIDSSNQNLKNNFEEEVTRTFAHEYMHAYREQKISWENGTFLDSLVSEGLSQNFELEIWIGGKLPIYATQLSEEEIKIAWKRVRPLLYGHEYDFDSWFFGSEKDSIKRWTGYSLGFWLVKKYMEKTGKKASELAQEDSEKFSSHSLF